MYYIVENRLRLRPTQDLVKMQEREKRLCADKKEECENRLLPRDKRQCFGPALCPLATLAARQRLQKRFSMTRRRHAVSMRLSRAGVTLSPRTDKQVNKLEALNEANESCKIVGIAARKFQQEFGVSERWTFCAQPVGEWKKAGFECSHFQRKFGPTSNTAQHES
jgi:hypothetical protein